MSSSSRTPAPSPTDAAAVAIEKVNAMLQTSAAIQEQQLALAKQALALKAQKFEADAAERAKIASAREISVRDLKPEMVSILDKFVKIRDATSPHTWQPFAENAQNLLLRLRGMSTLDRKTIVSEVCNRGKFVKVADLFTGEEADLAPGAVWQVELVRALGMQQPHIFLIEFAAARTTLAAYGRQIEFLVEWLSESARRVQQGEAPRVIEHLMAEYLLDCIEADQAHVAVRAQLAQVAAGATRLADVLNDSMYASAIIGKPLSRKPTSTKRYMAPRPAHAAARAAPAAPPEAARVMATSPVGVVARLKHQVARAWMTIAKPRGAARVVSAVIDPAATVSLVSRSFADSAGGSTAVCVDSTALDSLRVAGGEVQLGGARWPIIIDVAQLGGSARTAEAYVVDDLPCDFLAGLDTLGPVMNGTTIKVDAKGVATVEFDTAQPTKHSAPPSAAARATQDRISKKAPLVLLGNAVLEVVRGVSTDMLTDGSLSVGNIDAGVMAEVAEQARMLADERKSGTVDIHIRRSGEHAHVMLSVARLADDSVHDPVMDVGAPASGATFKFKSGAEKFLDAIDRHEVEIDGKGMPLEEKARLKKAVAECGVRFASKEAPPLEPHFLTTPDSIVHLRFRADANLDIVNGRWRPLQPQANEALRAQLAVWRKAGVLVPVEQGDARVVSLPLVVPKFDSDGNRTGWRVAIDLRPLNAQLEPDRLAAQPRIVLVREAARKAAAITMIDCASLFTQFKVRADHQRFFTMQTQPGVFEKMAGAPFGVSQMPGVAQHYMDRHLVQGDADKFVFIDDLAVLHGADWRSNVDQLITLLKRAATVGLVLNADKIQLAAVQPKVLGYVIDCRTHTFQINMAKVDAITSMQMPRTNAAMLRTVAMISALAHSVPAATMLVGRVRAQVRPGKVLQHTADGVAAWSELMALMASPIAMKAWDEERETIVSTDACDTGLGWCITQRHDGKEYLVHAGGRRTQSFEMRLSTPELEALALRHAFEVAPDMLIETFGGTTWRTDAQTVALARDQKSEIKSRAVRLFLAELSARNFGAVKIERIEGRTNLADAISRQWETAADVLVTVGGEDEPAAEAAEMPAPNTPVLEQSTDGGAVEQTQMKETGAEAVAQVAQAECTPQQAQAIEAALQETPELADQVAAERRAFAHAQAADTGKYMASMRAAQRGAFVGRKSTRMLVVTADAFGRLFAASKGEEPKLVVPDSEMRKVMASIHLGVVHRQAHTMVQQFEQHFANPRAAEVAKEIAMQCVACQRTERKKRDGELGFDATPYARFEKVAFDILEIRGSGPIDLGLLVQDDATGVFEVTPLAARNAEAVVEALRKGYFSRWPAPRLWQSDNAQELVGEAMKQLEAQYGVIRQDIAAKNPMANGRVERAVGLFKVALRKLTPIGGNWTDHVDQARWGLMCAVSKARGDSSPIQMATGVQPAMAAANQLDAKVTDVPEEIKRQGKKAGMAWQVNQLRVQSKLTCII
jgi:hypothetical protein